MRTTILGDAPTTVSTTRPTLLGEPPVTAEASRGTVYLPWVAQGTDGDPAADFLRLLRDDARQQRQQLTLCPSLVQAATWRVYGLVRGDPWDHADALGVSANEYARRAGCHLPANYAVRGNNIESLVAGTPDADVALAALSNSPNHADHIFGRNDFFREQRHVGIARAQGGLLGWYWCVMIGICEETSGE